MKTVLLIGIGAGNPDYVTMQAVKALNEADVFFFLDKGQEKEDLINLRRTICERFIEDKSYRIVEVPGPVRDVEAPDYKSGVQAWHRDKAKIFSDLIGNELADGEVGAFLVWGDPSLYDSTVRVIEHIIAEGLLAFEYKIIPGITSVQALAAEHKIALNPIGEPVHITTGRRLNEGLPDGVDTAVVMLDNGSGLRALIDEDVDIFWGAYLGTPDQVLISGKLKECVEAIEEARSEERKRKGWIMDTYLLRRKPRP
ncbi:precorrin-6A synthase (deacetylating) [Hyphomicrobium facile]|uniref:Precorrin-6A synthase [deacetylating] n=1 Tax=Hyphomicrobium facile TaxID=51670 RepID=A0A1I7NQZ1_9HYPH|nr:precorrin-6A synthase (deacetylating) [Hyphomicrobium facile]SFV37111.1 precorrin-6A synthase (deacetylating) [Hyphomicrobium facile]